MSNHPKLLDDRHLVIPVDTRTSVPDHKRGAVAIIGNLDGVHLGHQALIDDGLALADDINAPSAALIFEPHPRRVFQPDTLPFLLTSLEQKCELLIRYGIETVFVLQFDPALMSLSPDRFVKDILDHRLGLAGVVVGNEFQFGKGRAGKSADLTELGERQFMRVSLTAPAHALGAADKYSSSQARDAIRTGDMACAQSILGRLWSVRGTVQSGKRLGRTIGFPTANIRLGCMLAPARGVYAVETSVEGHRWPGIANFGQRPTVDGDELLLEVHIFGFNQDIYGQTIDVDFVEMIRPEQKFDSVDSLRLQITEDCARAEAILQQRSA